MNVSLANIVTKQINQLLLLNINYIPQILNSWEKWHNWWQSPGLLD